MKKPKGSVPPLQMGFENPRRESVTRMKLDLDQQIEDDDDANDTIHDEFMDMPEYSEQYTIEQDQNQYTFNSVG